jgi:hypothetical protein
MRIVNLSSIAVCLSWYCSEAFVVPKTSLKGADFGKVKGPSHVHSQRESTSLKAVPFLDNVLSTASSATSGMTSTPLFAYFLETVISFAVPTFFTILTIAYAASVFKRDKDDDDSMDEGTAITELYSDLYGDSKKESRGFTFGKPSKKKLNNIGIPTQEYIKITSMNEKLDSYDYSIMKATKSKAFAAAKYRSKSFDRALQSTLSGDLDLPAYAKAQLLEAEKNFLKEGKKLVTIIQLLEGQLAKQTIDKELKRLGMEKFEMDPEPLDAEIVESNLNVTLGKTEKSDEKKSPFGKSAALKDISKLQRELQQLELEFIKDVVTAVGLERAVGVRNALLGDIATRGTGGLLTQLEERPLSALLKGLSSDTGTKSLFVMRFPGDVTASQLDGLREEVTAIVRNSKAGDEALVILQSGGGTVTGYGLAAGQLVRLKEKGIFLTVAVEQVAASGGYMMTCVADRIVASPFAVLGSIGVISEIPNVYERLKVEGM